jgi:LuxR family transcriptional regulator, quorum-sensing system regulator CviR
MLYKIEYRGRINRSRLAACERKNEWLERHGIVMGIKRLLSHNDLAFLLDLIHSCLFCTAEEELRDIIGRLKHLFPHEYAVCALHRTDPSSIDVSKSFINVSYPLEWCRLYIEKGFDKVDPIVQQSAARHGIQYWSDTYKRYGNAKTFMHCARDFSLSEGYSYGTTSLNGQQRALFSFSGRTVKRHPRTELILEYAIPHLSQAFNRITECGKERRPLSEPLSSRETEVLKWVKDGKSTWEISVILSISSNTVKFHLKNIMQKLQAVTRTQAVASALEFGIIHSE